jgi:hypothetical protein
VLFGWILLVDDRVRGRSVFFSASSPTVYAYLRLRYFAPLPSPSPSLPLVFPTPLAPCPCPQEASKKKGLRHRTCWLLMGDYWLELPASGSAGF